MRRARRQFQWFIEGDILALPAWISPLTLALYSVILAVFLGRQEQLYWKHGTVNWGKVEMVLATAAVWCVGIVMLNSDFAFTLTNVVAHGVPYMALVWIFGCRRWSAERSWLATVHRPAMAGAFVGLLLVLAYFEEGLWDLLVWQEHGIVFGDLPSLGAAVDRPAGDALRARCVDLEFDGSNPGLQAHLFGKNAAKIRDVQPPSAIHPAQDMVFGPLRPGVVW